VLLLNCAVAWLPGCACSPGGRGGRRTALLVFGVDMAAMEGGGEEDLKSTNRFSPLRAQNCSASDAHILYPVLHHTVFPEKPKSSSPR
jgi:hypothetical protein